MIDSNNAYKASKFDENLTHRQRGVVTKATSNSEVLFAHSIVVSKGRFVVLARALDSFS